MTQKQLRKHKIDCPISIFKRGNWMMNNPPECNCNLQEKSEREKFADELIEEIKEKDIHLVVDQSGNDYGGILKVEMINIIKNLKEK